MHDKSRQPVKLWATDGDGTVWNRSQPDHQASRTLIGRVESYQHTGILIPVLVTGRRHEGALAALSKHGFPTEAVGDKQPFFRAIIGGVGTQMHLANGDRIGPWEQHLRTKGWNTEDRARIDEMLKVLGHSAPALQRKQLAHHLPYKLGYYVEPSALSATWADADQPGPEVYRAVDTFVTDTVKPQLARHGFKAEQDYQLILSPDEKARKYNLDVLSPHTGKGYAVHFLAELLGINLSDTLRTGDSGNDILLFDPGARNGTVGNRSPELDQHIRAHSQLKVVVSAKKYSAGVLDVMQRSGFLDGNP